MIKYLSLLSGIGGFELALQKVFPDAHCVGYSEIDPYALKVYQEHFPGHPNLGDVRDVLGQLNEGDIDMLVAGFPCQDLSKAKQDRQGLKGDRSGLFGYLSVIIAMLQPELVLLENVASMGNLDKTIISNAVDIEPVMVDAALVSAQRRKRLFWCNWEVNQPEDRGAALSDVVIDGTGIHGDKTYPITATYYKAGNLEYSLKYKQRTLVMPNDGSKARKLTPEECEVLQGFPKGWTDGVSNTQRYKMLGNAVHVDVATHIFNELKKELIDA